MRESGVEIAVDVKTLAKAVERIIVRAKVLVGSDVYLQRMARCFRHPDNFDAIKDFLLLDDLFLAVLPLAGSYGQVEELLDLRKKAIRIAEPPPGRFAEDKELLELSLFFHRRYYEGYAYNEQQKLRRLQERDKKRKAGRQGTPG